MASRPRAPLTMALYVILLFIMIFPLDVINTSQGRIQEEIPVIENVYKLGELLPLLPPSIWVL